MGDRWRRRRHGSLALGLAVTMAACLPRGAPPGGRQVVADWQATLEAIVPPNGDGVLRILILKPGASADSQDLYLVSVDDAGGPPSEGLLVRGVNPQDDFGCIDMVAPCSLIKPDGSLWVGLVRINPYTGEKLAIASSPVLSASGQRFFVGDTSGGTLYEPDGSKVAIVLAPPSSDGSVVPSGNVFAFYGEDFYYLTAEAELVHLPPSGVPEQLAAGVVGFRGSSTPDGTLLILTRATSESGSPGVLRSRSAHRCGAGGAVRLPFLQHLARRAVAARHRCLLR